MEQKSNKVLVWIIVILTTLVLGFGGYILYDKVVSKDFIKNDDKTKVEIENNDNDNSNDNENIKQSDLNEIAQNLFKRIKNTSWGSIEYNFDNKDKITFENMSDKHKHQLVWKDLYLNDKIESIDGDGDGYYDGVLDYEIIKLSDFKNSVKRIFGVNNEEKFNYLNEFNASYLYYKLESQEYKGTVAAMDNYASTEYYLNSYAKDGDKFHIYVAHVFEVRDCADGFDANKCPEYYQDSSTQELLFKGEYNFDDNIEKIGLYKFTFKLENDNYIFESVEKA